MLTMVFRAGGLAIVVRELVTSANDRKSATSKLVHLVLFTHRASALGDVPGSSTLLHGSMDERPMAHVLFVDADVQLRTLTCEYIRRYGVRVTELATGRDLKRVLRPDKLSCKPSQQSFDLLLLDLMLPDENGLDLCRWVHNLAPLPVIMLTARGDQASGVVSLELGACDFLTKPFEPLELVARIHAVLRRPAIPRILEPAPIPEAAAQQHFAGWRFDRFGHVLRSPQQVSVKLSSGEFRLLCAFVDRPKRVLSRSRLIELAQAPGAATDGRAIDLAVSRLRHKLSGEPGAPMLIRTVRHQGYIFVAAVEGEPS